MKINILAPRDNWILHRLGDELHKRLDYITLNREDKNNFDINYYINYCLFQEKSKNLDLAYFTHIEVHPDKIKQFFRVAKEVDHCVSLSKMYANVLAEYKGLNNVTQIVPGIDLEQFKPKLILVDGLNGFG